MSTPLGKSSCGRAVLLVAGLLLITATGGCRRRGSSASAPTASATQEPDVREVRCIERPEGCIWCEARGGTPSIPEPDRPGLSLCNPKDTSDCVEFCTKLASECAAPWHQGPSCLVATEIDLRRELFKLETADRPEVVLQGRVVDETGKRLEGAHARVWFQGTPVAEETTGKDGIFRLKLRAGNWSYTVRVSRPGLASEIFELKPDPRADRSPGATPRLVRLEGEAPIRGRIADGDGAPIEGVTVQALRSADDPTEASEARTGEDGSFTLGGLEANKRYTIRASKFGWLSMVYKWPVQAPGRIGAKMVRTGVIDGEVVDGDGEGEAGAMVVALLADNLGGGSPIVWSTDLKGHFAQDRFQVGTYYLWARHGDLLAYPPEKIELTAEQLQGTVKLSLTHRGARVKGKVASRDGSPLEPDTRVILISRSPLAMPRKAVGEVDRQGGFTVSGILPGRYEIGLRVGPRALPIVRGPRELEVPIEAGAKVDIAEPIVIKPRPEE